MKKTTKRYNPTWFSERLVPILMALILLGLVFTLLVIGLSVLGLTPGA